ncbi:TetR/AcrR family transcriptional regulator [Blautia sp.]|uniref:TetR/AcrR family transcriptional regulator n=1 Tax=Blautia sp. TaxID=1955243 RepID=UPI003A4A2A25
MTDAYIECACQKGLCNVTLKDVCEQADIYRSTFYAYFKNLDELLLCIENKFLEDSSQVLKKTGSIQTDETFAAVLIEYILSQKKLLLVLLASSGSTRFLAKYKNYLKNLLQESRHLGDR